MGVVFWKGSRPTDELTGNPLSERSTIVMFRNHGLLKIQSGVCGISICCQRVMHHTQSRLSRWPGGCVGPVIDMTCDMP